MVSPLRISVRLCVTIGLVATLYILALSSSAQASPNTTLHWKPNGKLGIAGYRVYLRNCGGGVGKIIDTGNQLSITLDELPPETKFVCTITAYNTLGFESKHSSELSFTTPPSDPTMIIRESGPALSFTGKPGRVIDIYQSIDFQSWSLVKSVVNLTGNLELPYASLNPQSLPSFYRFESRGESFEAWMQLHGYDDPLGDANNDGISNLFTFATGGDLMENARKALPKFEVTSDESQDESQDGWQGEPKRFATYTYTYREDNADYRPLVEVSSDLAHWESAAGSTTVTQDVFNGDGTRTISLRGGTHDVRRQYFRLRFIKVGQSYSDWLREQDQHDPAHIEAIWPSGLYDFASGSDLVSNRALLTPSAGITRTQVSGQSISYRTFSYVVRAGVLGVKEVVEASSDLITWTDVTSEFIILSKTLNSNGTETITLRDSLPLSARSGAPQCFRLRLLSTETWSADSDIGSNY